MGLNVVVHIIKAYSSYTEENQRVTFKGVVTVRAVDETDSTIEVLDFVIPSIEEYQKGYLLLGKVAYAQVERVGEDNMIWFLDESPFEDEWREEVLLQTEVEL